MKDAQLQLRYARHYLASCSIFADAKGCWAKIKQNTGLKKPTPPDCSAAYKAVQIADDPTVVVYEVETVLDAARYKTVPLRGKLACYPAE